MYEFWYDYVKPKYGEKKLLHGYRQFHCLKTGDSYKDIAVNVEIRLDPSSNE